MNVPKFKRDRYQQGSLTTEKRNSGPDVWVFRWREQAGGDKTIQRKRIVGSVREYRSETAARKAVDTLTLDINAVSGVGPSRSVTISQLADHYVQNELTSGSRTALTVKVYRHHIERVILPRWGEIELKAIKPMLVER